MKIATIGIDLAKEVFAIHGVDANDHTVLSKYGQAKLTDFDKMLFYTQSANPMG